MSSTLRNFAPRGLVIRSAITPKIFTTTFGGTETPIFLSCSNGVLGLASFDSALFSQVGRTFAQRQIQASVKQGLQSNVTQLSQQLIQLIGLLQHGSVNAIVNPVVTVPGVAQQTQLSTYSLENICTNVANGTSFYSDGYPITYILTQPVIFTYLDASSPGTPQRTIELLNGLEGCCGGGGGGSLPEGVSYSDYLYWDPGAFGTGAWLVGSTQVHIGQNAGQITQGPEAIAIGRQAGQGNQGDSSIAIGLLAGNTNQAQYCIAIGDSAGFTGQGRQGGNPGYSIAIGYFAGNFLQGDEAVAIGRQAGQSNQGESAIAIGDFAGQSNQGNKAIAIGENAGVFTQGGFAIAIGEQAGFTGQGVTAIAIGQNAGQNTQGSGAIAIGLNAGNSQQQQDAISIGTITTPNITSQCQNGIAIGINAICPNLASPGPSANQNAIAIGVSARAMSDRSLAIGAGSDATGQYSIAIGTNADTNADYAIAIGEGSKSYSDPSIAIGSSAEAGFGLSATQPHRYAIAIGAQAQAFSTNCIAIGRQALTNTAASSAIAIGYEATCTANSTIAIGNGAKAGALNSIALGNSNSNNQQCIVISAMAGAPLQDDQNNALFIDPIRLANNNNVLLYNTTSAEVTYQPIAYGSFYASGNQGLTQDTWTTVNTANAVPAVTLNLTTGTGGVVLTNAGTYRVSVRLYIENEGSGGDPGTANYIAALWNLTTTSQIGQNFALSAVGTTGFGEISWDEIITTSSASIAIGPRVITDKTGSKITVDNGVLGNNPYGGFVTVTRVA